MSGALSRPYPLAVPPPAISFPVPRYNVSGPRLELMDLPGQPQWARA